MYSDQPAHHVFDALVSAMWPNHALGRPITGYINSVKSFKRNDLAEFMGRFYQPANMFVVACGKIDRRKILEFSRNIFSEPSKRRKFPYQLVKKKNKAKSINVLYKDIKQAHVVFGFHSLCRTHKLRYALARLNLILGGNMSSRLFERLREKMALCYDISSSVRRYKETGALVIHAGVDDSKLATASRGIIRELREMKENPVTSGELCRAKEYASGQLLLSLEDTASRMMWLGGKIMAEGKAPSVAEIFKKVNSVTAEDIKEAANLIFNSKNLNFATIGPARRGVKKKLREMFEI